MRTASLIVLPLLLGAIAAAQSVDASLLGGSVDLGPKWLFHAGDHSSWSRPDLNDRDWQTVSTTVGAPAGSEAPAGYSWYRLHIHIPPQHPALSMLVDETGNPYEVFVNGTRVGSFGSFPPHVKRFRNLPSRFHIPPEAAAGDSLVIAIKTWTRADDWGGLRGLGPVRIGSDDDISSAFHSEQRHIMAFGVPDMCVRFLSIALAAGLLSLYRWNREFKEYLWIAAYFFVMTAWTILLDYRSIAPVGLDVSQFLDVGLLDVGYVLLLQFAFAFLKRGMPRWLRWYQISIVFQPVLIYAFHGFLSGSVTDLIVLLWSLPFAFLLPGIVFWHYLKGQQEAGLLAIPLFLINLNDMMRSGAWLLFETGLRRSSTPVAPIFIGPVRIYIGQIEGLLFVLSIGAILLYRFHRTTQEKARVQSELEAARSMQDVMVPKRLHEAAGFAIESAYIPAQEVGGDFFQLYPAPDRSLLVVVGDVSGKGVKAAMLVSMILGVLRRSIENTRSPSVLLSDLNRCMMGQTDGKFATCCCVLLEHDGRVRAANAGHLSPYCDGVEIELPGGIPLGLCEDPQYDEVDLHLPPGKRWLFISDGVVEARNKTGELYGFERTRSISVLTVGQVAATAQQFGQEDDITVLGVERRMVAYA